MATRLGSRDQKILQRCIAELYTIGDLVAFRGRVVDVVSTAVRGDVTVCAEIDPVRGRISWNPEAAAAIGLADAPRIYSTHLADLPLTRSYRRGDGSAVKISDFVTQREFRRTALYNEFYRRAGLEYHIAKGLPGPAGLVTALGILRKARDFSERDRLILNLLRPHLNQSYLNAVAVTRMEQDLTLMRRGIDALSQGVAIIDHDGQVALMTSRAQAWIEEYFGPWRTGALPDDLQCWLHRHDERLRSDGDSGRSGGPLIVDGGAGRHLTVRLVCDNDRRLLLFSEDAREHQPERLEALGLSRREAEVLTWVAEGKTNAEVAAILGTSARTIDKHLQHVFGKMGVETRTAAAARALAILRG